MIFDRYKIHIQAFVGFVNGKISFVDHHLHENILRNIYSKLYMKHIFQKHTFTKKRKLQTNKIRKTWWVHLSNISKLFKFQDFFNPTQEDLYT